MNTKRMITRALELIRDIRTNNIEEKENRVELTNARFGINLDANFKDQKKAADSLTFMMYSKENETLFI
ncbi:hypothetical protein EOD40_14795 [Flavobacterium sufflavum]|uniref:Uncharacterized protein n=1 Tax=Flavobacterium sufflavum TaxID=1921138 RepID=A0A437KNV5_9FLAO|nr:hypothetical protein [Flavobacterium sufflavum]RVT73123.1 hypothetical protein EOD40_14795 [Flavobacterium sufflavum]